MGNGLGNASIAGVALLALAAPTQAHLTAGSALERGALRHLTLSVASCPAGVPVQTITVLDDANVPAVVLARVERAVTAQSLQLRRYWHTRCAVFGAAGWPLKLASHTDCVQVGQRCILFGNPGYHNGKPEPPPWTNRFYPSWAEVSTLDTESAPSWSVAFSHETLEMLANPTGLAYYLGSPREVCDPVETVSYRLRGVWVSDFVTKAWFHSYGHTAYAAGARFDETGRIHQPGDDSLS